VRVDDVSVDVDGVVVVATGKWYCNECSVVRKKQGIIKK
jgi:hypothetical protein